MKAKDPMDVPMIFLRVGWMSRYRGLAGDSISGGGKHVAKHKWGQEIFNFRPYRGRVYGYAQPVAKRDKWDGSTIKLEKVSGAKASVTLKGVLVVWLATEPGNGGWIVGWYNNAILHRRVQASPNDPGRKCQDKDYPFYAEADVSGVVCLPTDERNFAVDYKAEGMGNSNVWYASDPAKHREFRQRVLDYIDLRQPSVPEAETVHQQDPDLRKKVESTAVDVVKQHFSDLGYLLESVEKDNKGWDLEARLGKRFLRLEVKGLAGSGLTVELTPNEYRAMENERDSFRLCVVRNTLTAPELFVFAYSGDSNAWESVSPHGRKLDIKEMKAARCTAV